MQRKEGRGWWKRVKAHPGHMSIPSIYVKKLRNSPADGGEARKSLSTSGYFSSCRKSGVGSNDSCGFGSSIEEKQLLAQSPPWFGERLLLACLHAPWRVLHGCGDSVSS